ncbi:AraC family transcriptional regulator [Rhodoferax aquaticus]|uniref:AraC family transcriptional regulator n=1 Tax=Rhodoferax aquaticus TaxID=2527691 RepID=A0A515ENM7_9BURK|nr:AraC family transcriptional regulator [Rhodoferax aquaticus]QDL54276.1 AraC family transcriptional regulator [Rhodoferax aquaticus]
MKHASKFVVLRGWKLLMADMGLNLAEVLAWAQLPADLFTRPGATLSPEDFFRLWTGMEQVAGGEELPLKFGQAISVEAFDPPIFASLCAPNLATALVRLSDFKRLIGPMILDVQSTPACTSVALDCYGHTGALPRSLAITEMVFFTQLARLATRKHITPLRVEITQLPSNLVPLEAFFGCSPQPSTHNRITFSAEDAKHPFLTEDSGMWESFEPTLRKRLAALDAQATTVERVHSALLELLPSGRSSVEEVADKLLTSRRTLQRQLSDEGSSFQEVLSNTRQRLAEHYLRQSTITPGEVSWLLGFQDGNSFIRAFRNWTGTTPGQFRAAAWV